MLQIPLDAALLSNLYLVNEDNTGHGMARFMSIVPELCAPAAYNKPQKPTVPTTSSPS